MGSASKKQSAVAPGVGMNMRKKAVGVRPWLVLDSTGQAQVVDVGKQVIMRRTGLPARDLRILDPFLSYPSTILGRERAIVINLEHIKAIITGHEVLLLNPRDPSVVPFVEELQGRMMHHYEATKSQEAGDGNRANWTKLYDLNEPQSRIVNQNNLKRFPNKEEVVANIEDDAEKQHSSENRLGPKLLPFEFVALEACLESACTCLDNEARTLEEEAQPALDKLTSKISTLNLERVRQLKSRLVAITGRVQKVRDELENLLDDENDMAEMYLTGKVLCSSKSSINEQADDTDEDEEDMDERTSHAERNETSSRSDGNHGTDDESAESDLSKRVDVEELEMLLESYFIQIDGTLNKLSTLREYVDDTEDYINIMLDDKQNHLLQMGVMLTTATLVVTAFVVLVGVLGMNIRIELFKDQVHGMTRFLWTVGGGSACTVFLYLMAIAWYKHKRLVE